MEIDREYENVSLEITFSRSLLVSERIVIITKEHQGSCLATSSYSLFLTHALIFLVVNNNK